MRNRVSLKTGRALMLGLFVLFMTQTSTSQVKSAIERMNDRIAEWQKAPANRFVGFEVAFPATAEEAGRIGNNALLLVTTASSIREEAFSSRAIVAVDGKPVTLPTFGNTLISQHPEGYYRSDRIMVLPLKWITPNTELKVTYGTGSLEISLGSLPESKLSAPANAEVSTPALHGPVTSMLQREFNGMEIQPQKVRISSGVAAANLLKQARLKYPDDAKKSHISGQVVLSVTIGTDGRLQNIHVISGQPMLVDAAIDCVRQWEYKPYLLNGKPVEVETQIVLNFTLG